MNQCETTLISQVNIQENDIRQGHRRDRDETLFQSSRKDCFMPFGFEPVLEEFAIRGIVLHHENPMLHSVSFYKRRAQVPNRFTKPETLIRFNYRPD